MKKETADLVDLQELFEMAGPSIFLVSLMYQVLLHRSKIKMVFQCHPDLISLTMYLLYQNVLGRTPGQFEINYYKERFESGTTDWNTTLVFFAESPENVSLVAPQIEDGIWMPF